MNAHRRKLAFLALVPLWLATYADTPAAQASAPSAPGGVAPPIDLLTIRTIAVNALQFARSGDLGNARAQVEALESQWRQAKSKMPSVSPQKRQAIDAAIDRVERELRFWRARRTDSAAALQTLLDVIDQTS